MKLITILIFLILVFYSYSQDTVVSLTTQSTQVMYWNIENSIEFTIAPSSLDYQVNCTNCDTFFVSKQTNTYLATVGKGRYTEFVISSLEKPSVVYSKKRIQNNYIPNPTLYFGSAMNGTKCSKFSTLISAKYTSKMNLNYNFEVQRWVLYINDKKYSGDGNKLTAEAQNYLNNETFLNVSIIQ